MSSLAVCTIIGRLTRDSELKFTNGGQACAHFTLATDDKKKDAKVASFWDITLWGKPAESLNQYLIKGKLIAVSGKMLIDQWEQEGQKREKIKITADSVQLLESKSRTDEPKENHAPLESTNRPVYQKAKPAADDFDDDLPPF